MLQNVTMGSYNIDPTWYIDSRATNHITSELDKLTVQEKYFGKDQVYAANGLGMSIALIS